MKVVVRMRQALIDERKGGGRKEKVGDRER
jgi:hypothetical protein